jgi:ABC-2 type transport system permease protein
VTTPTQTSQTHMPQDTTPEDTVQTPQTDRPHSAGAMVRLVAGREITTRIRDKGFLIGSAVLIVLILGMMLFQVAMNSGNDETKIGVVGGNAVVEQALVAQGDALGTDVTVTSYADEAAARAAVEDEDVDGALLGPAGPQPQLVLKSEEPGAQSLVQGALTSLSTAQQLSQAGVQLQPGPQVELVTLDPDAENRFQATIVALVGVVVLYGLIILFGQFVAQGVVEEKSSRVVELLLATMRPWQLLAGKVIGLGLLGLAQILVISVVGVVGALALDVVDLPGDVIVPVVTVIAWFVLGYAFYASVFAAAASLVSRQEDLGSVITPASMVLIIGFVISVQAAQSPGGTLATVTSFIPGVSPMVMPVRMAAGEAAWWEVGVAVLLMLVAISAVIRIGGRVYSGALLRTSGKMSYREALRAERV